MTYLVQQVLLLVCDRCHKTLLLETPKTIQEAERYAEEHWWTHDPNKGTNYCPKCTKNNQ